MGRTDRWSSATTDSAPASARSARVPVEATDDAVEHSFEKSVKRTGSRRPWLPAGILLVMLVIPALFAGQITAHDPVRGNLADQLMPPVWQSGGTWNYPLGTDVQGRDILTRIIYGARVSLVVSITAVFLGGSLGTALGLVAGYFGGRIDQGISFLVDTFLSIPSILLALTIASAVGPSFATVIIILSIAMWARFARQIRGETLAIRESDFVARAKVAGASSTRIIVRHVLPNVTNTLVVLVTLSVGVAILSEASLSFIGAGIPPPSASWGVMVADGRDQIVTAWWVSFFPGMAILLVVLSLNLLGDWLRDYLDPRLRQQV